jgi:hypothetical protein
MIEELQQDPTSAAEGDDPQLTHAAVRAQYAAEPDANPALLAHMDHLVAREQGGSVSHELAASVGTAALAPEGLQDVPISAEQNDDENPESLASEQLNKLFDSIAQHADSLSSDQLGTLAKDMSRQPGGIFNLLEEGRYTAQELNGFIGRVRNYEISSYYVPILLEKAPDNLLSAAYSSEEEEKPSVIHDAITEHLQSTNPDLNAVRCLRKIHGTQDVLALSDTAGPHQADANVQKLISSESFSSIVLGADMSDQLSTAEKAARPLGETYEWTERYFKSLGLSEKLIDDIVFASFGRTTDKNGELDYDKYRAMVSGFSERTQRLDAEAINKLRAEAVIIDMDYYDVEQLDRMKRLVEGDRELIEYLQAGDVTVVFADSSGDPKGALKSDPQTYETSSGRTLGIKPSTVVFSAHGEPVDGMDFGDQGPGGRGFRIASHAQKPEDIAGDSLEILVYMVDEMMQDSRGIDDNEAAIGRRRIILDACHQEVRRSLVERVDQDGKVVISVESTAVSIVRAVNDPRLDVYAAPAAMGSMKTDTGMRMVEFYDPEDRSRYRDMDTSRVRVDAGGNLMEERVATVELHRYPTASREQVIADDFL